MAPPCLSLLKRLIKVQGVPSNDSLADGAGRSGIRRVSDAPLGRPHYGGGGEHRRFDIPGTVAIVSDPVRSGPAANGLQLQSLWRIPTAAVSAPACWDHAMPSNSSDESFSPPLRPQLRRLLRLDRR